MPEHCRIVDARYLAPDIPAETPPTFGVADGARVIPVNDLVREESLPSQYVVVGSGKTATDACIWLLGSGVDPDAICWVRPREPWMLNRALIQPDPAIYLGMVADMMRAAGAATSLRRAVPAARGAGIMLRIDRSVTPTMAKSPTLGTWELEQLRIDRERRTPRPHRHGEPRPDSTFADGSVAVADDALVVNCAADGLKIRRRSCRSGGRRRSRCSRPGRVPVLRGRARRVRRGDARRRRREEPAVPTVVVRQHA